MTYRAKVLETGAADALQAVTGADISAPSGVTAVSDGSRLWVIGYAGGSSTLYSAVVSADGSLSAWQTAASPIHSSSELTSAVVYGSRIFAVLRVAVPFESDLFSLISIPILADGALGTSAVVRDYGALGWDYVYHLATVGSLLLQSTSLSGFPSVVSRINADGSLNDLNTFSSADLYVDQQSESITAAGSFLYAFTQSGGGSRRDPYTTMSVSRAALNADGTIAAWQATNAPPSGHAAADWCNPPIPVSAGSRTFLFAGLCNADLYGGAILWYSAEVSPFSLASMLPPQGPAGTFLALSGSDFVAGTAVTIGGTPVWDVNVRSSRLITATAPPHVAGASDVVVTSIDGRSASIAGAYTYLDTPPCTYSVSAQNTVFGLAGGTGTIVVNASATTCIWRTTESRNRLVPSIRRDRERRSAV